MKSFVWLPSQSGPQAQIWYDQPKDGNGKLKIKPLFEVELTGVEKHLSIEGLIKLYPKPEENKE